MAGMIKQQSRAGSANVTVPARRGGGGVVREGTRCKDAVCEDAVLGSAVRAGAVRGARGRKGAARLAVPLVVPLAGVAACLAACSSTSSGAKPASPAVHETSLPKSGRSMSSVSPMPTSPTVAPTVSPSISAAACDHVRALRQDLISVTHIKFNGGTAKVVVVDLNDISKQLTALKNEPALATEVGALTGAITNVQGAVKALSSPPTAAQLKAVITAFNNMKLIASPVIPKLKAACP